MKYEDLIAKRKACRFGYKVVIRTSDVQKQKHIYDWVLSNLSPDAYALEQAVIAWSDDRKYFFKTGEDAVLLKLTWA